MGDECENCGKVVSDDQTAYVVEENHFGGRSFMLCNNCLNGGLRLRNQYKGKYGVNAHMADAVVVMRPKTEQESRW